MKTYWANLSPGSHGETTPSQRCNSRSSRPKSSPASRLHDSYSTEKYYEISRPKTASSVNNECDRLSQVEAVSTRQHKLISHFDVRKEKPAPWQAQLELEQLTPQKSNMAIADGVQKTVHVAPGYILSRNKAKYKIVINDKLFGEDDSRPTHKQTALNPEINSIIEKLKQEVADLTLFLEEERLMHRETKRKAEEFLQDKLTEMKTDHREALRRQADYHRESLNKLISENEQIISEKDQSYNAIVEKQRTEMGFLQAAFESYKSQTHAEHKQMLKDAIAELQSKHSQELQNRLQDLASRLKGEHSAAMASANREHNLALAELDKQNKLELEMLNRRFTNHAADIKKLKEAEEKCKDLEMKCEDAKREYEACEKELKNTIRERDDYKAKLVVFEKDFEQKVSDVDSKYRQKVNDITNQNALLRRKYLQKCDELYNTKAETDVAKSEKIMTTKETMKALIKSRSNAYVSVAANNINIKCSYPKSRPFSAPATHQEEIKALETAGETDAYVARNEKPFVRPQSVLEMSAVFDIDELTTLSEKELNDGLQLRPS